MESSESRVTIHMVSSLDFFIASPDGGVSLLETSDRYEQGAPDEDPAEFLKSIDCYVMGSRTYELALELGWPYGDVPTVVLTRRDLRSDRESVEFRSGDLRELVNDRLRPRHRSIWVVGGATVARDFLRLGLADDLRITIVPILLGGGLQFVDPLGEEQALHLKDVTAYRNGLVELWYEVRRDTAGK